MKDKPENPQASLEMRQQEMTNSELINLAERNVTQLAMTGGRSHIMCVPPEVTDTDILFSELIRRFKAMLAERSKSNE